MIKNEKRQELESSENLFKTFVNNNHNLAWIADRDGWIYWYNDRWYEYTGTTIQQMEGSGWQKVHHPDHLENIILFVQNAWSKNEPFELTFPLRRHDGEFRWFLTRAIPVLDPDNNIEKWIGTNTDITEQKEYAEELERKIRERTAELEKRKNLFESILETSKEYIAVYDSDFKLLTINNATETMIGQKRQEVIGKTLLELMPHSKGSKEESDLKSALQGNKIYNPPYQSSITGRYIENYINPLKDGNGNVYAAVAIANDVSNILSKQKEIEATRDQLQLQNQTFELAETIANIGSYKWNMKSGKLEYSDNLFRLLDCEPQTFTPTWEKFLSFIHPEDLAQVISDGEKTMQTGQLSENPYRIISQTGTVKYFRSNGKFTGKGDNILLYGSVQDISKDVKASKELIAKNQELENANTELASFSYIASHDLKEPLRKIQGFSKLIMEKDDEKLSDTALNYFNRINVAAQRMQNLIESLLIFSRTNHSEKVFQETDLEQIFEEVKSILNEKITSKNAVFEVQPLPIMNAIPFQMHQLFLNLISNALKYTKPGISPIIKITAEKVNLNEDVGESKLQGDFWKIAISDNGIGFESKYENKIFELFQRLHSKSEYDGTGIGLAICKKILQIHKGTIIAKSVPEEGSIFTFYILDNIQ